MLIKGPQGKSRIQGMQKIEIDSEIAKSWIERRPRIPANKEDKDRLVKKFQQEITEQLKLSTLDPSLNQPICSNEEFDNTYKIMTNIIVNASFKTFGHCEMKSEPHKLKSPKIRTILREIHQLGKIITSIRGNTLLQIISDYYLWAV